ncbi:hypothetical protein [Paenibacillus peoriae]|uniref:hypothetical protein n=1 Tax=Paenibacillus peoriae TaxID=59893 RepID=UPI00096FF4A1|nr:hypothetical protein [Paenibacillus peoriae]OMF51265.1 hypothetical protein BK135_03240 [Paenibacillus peoriae]
MYSKIVAINDAWVKPGMDHQVLDADSRYYGGVTDDENGIAWPNHSVGTPAAMAIWAAALVNPDSVYYRKEDVLIRLELAAQYMLRVQHEDGSISPGWTNFHSPPDTAFVVVGYAQVYQLLVGDDWLELRRVIDAIRLFLDRTIPVMLTGGCHTPNHRWVLCAALGFLHELFDLPETLVRAEAWLAEGLDGTPDGEWTERSNGIYNAVSDIMLIHAARLLKLPELLESVRRNLRMMVYLVHPDGEVVTEYSGRQDFGVVMNLSSYLLPYAMLATEDEDAIFEAMAVAAIQVMDHPGGAPINAAVRFLLDPRLQTRKVSPATLPVTYNQLLNGDFPRADYLSRMDEAGHHQQIYHSRLHTDFGAPVVRFRQEDTSATLMTEASSFLSLRHGDARLLAVQAASYFSPGFVPMQKLTAHEHGWTLSGTQVKGYYGPVATLDLPPTAQEEVSPWYLLPHHKRPLTHEQKHEIRVDVDRQGDVWTLRFRSEGPVDCMTQISFIFGREGRFTCGEYRLINETVQCWTGGMARYESGNAWFELMGTTVEHMAKSVRGATLPMNFHTLLVNWMAPFDQTIRIRMSPLPVSEV